MNVLPARQNRGMSDLVLSLTAVALSCLYWGVVGYVWVKNDDAGERGTG